MLSEAPRGVRGDAREGRGNASASGRDPKGGSNPTREARGNALWRQISQGAGQRQRGRNAHISLNDVQLRPVVVPHDRRDGQEILGVIGSALHETVSSDDLPFVRCF